MTPEQALQAIDEATAQLRLNRQETMIIIQAIQTIQKSLQELAELQKAPSPKSE